MPFVAELAVPPSPPSPCARVLTLGTFNSGLFGARGPLERYLGLNEVVWVGPCTAWLASLYK